MTQRASVQFIANVLGTFVEYAGQYRDGFPDFTGTWDNGTGEAQADAFYYDRFSISGSTLVELDNLTDIEGNALVFAEVRLLALFCDVANTDYVSFQIPGTGGWEALSTIANASFIIQPGTMSVPILTSQDGGYPVPSPSAGDANFNLIPNSGTQAGHLLVIGTTA